MATFYLASYATLVLAPTGLYSVFTYYVSSSLFYFSNFSWSSIELFNLKYGNILSGKLRYLSGSSSRLRSMNEIFFFHNPSFIIPSYLSTVKRIILYITLFLGLVANSSCAKNKTSLPETPETIDYLHLSHTRLDDNSGIMTEATGIDYSKYDIVMLGGDLLYLTSDEPAIMELTNSIFNISDPNVLWSVGNHDYTNPSLIPQYTGRPLHYAYHKNGITYVVLDTEADSCNISGSQLTLLNNVTDTISESSHLIVMTHKLIWMYGNTHLEPLAISVSNGSIGLEDYQINPNNFYDGPYWNLLEVQNRGIQVICLAGDLGLFTSRFEFRFDSGIQLLASGGHFNFGGEGIIFHHTPATRSLTWEYVPMEEL